MIYYTTGKPRSQWYEEQQKGSLKYPVIMFWLYGQPDVLDARLDQRVDDMIHRGLLIEIQQMRRLIHDKKVVGSDNCIGSDGTGAYTRGILQAIGFKEFHDYFEALEQSKNQDIIDQLFKKGVSDMKLATRQYARKQINWMKNKIAPALIPHHTENKSAIYLIDATSKLYYDLDLQELVEIVPKAIDLVYQFRQDSANQSSSVLAPNLQHLLRTPEKEIWAHHKCSFCLDANGNPRDFIGEKVWRKHINSRRHKRMISNIQRPRPTTGDKEAWLKYLASATN